MNWRIKTENKGGKDDEKEKAYPSVTKFGGDRYPEGIEDFLPEIKKRRKRKMGMRPIKSTTI